MIGDIWQWTPFMFIVLLAALEGQPGEQIEAALVDGADRWQIFRYITWPAILPVSTTLILIRMIEAFKIVDLPNVLTNGGPGIATESLTLHAFMAWRTLDLGGSAAVAYMLLFLVTFFCVAFVNLVRRRGRQRLMAEPASAGRRPVPQRSDEPVAGRPRRVLRPAGGLWAFVVLFPLYWLAVTSFKLPIQVDSGPFYFPFVDFQPSLHAWRYLFVDLLTTRCDPTSTRVVAACAAR